MNNKDYGRSPLRVLAQYFRPHRGLFVLDLSCALVMALIDLAFPLVARSSMNQLLPARQFDTFFTVMIIVAAAFVIRAGMNYIITYWGHMFGVRVEADLRDDLFRHMQSLDFKFFDNNRTGQLMNRMTGDLFEITELSHHGPEDLFVAFVTIVGAICIMFTVQWQLALVILIIIPIFLAVVMLCRKNMVTTSRNVKITMSEINGEIESALSGIRTSKAFANEEADYRKFAQANEKFKTASSYNGIRRLAHNEGQYELCRSCHFLSVYKHLYKSDKKAGKLHRNIYERLCGTYQIYRPYEAAAGG